ncbi:MAG: NAD(P)H-dependent oxidoreductase [Rikenellaceae bacterium]|jgi:chromate reductase|nr:NAD(P)H-dependent oxidoreductase [Rikenellaceae bacterium]
MKTAVLIGGISRNSLNHRFFDEVARLNRTSLDFEVADIAALPFFSQDIENDPPASVLKFKKLITSSEAVLIVTPEYNRSMPGVLKNALDWASRPAGQNLWAGKPTAIMGAATGAIGTFGAQQHLRQVCVQLDMPVMNQPTVYFNSASGMDAEGHLTDRSAEFLTKFLTAFEQWAHVINH